MAKLNIFFIGKQEFVDINGTTYFIDALGGYNRQLATAMCGYQNMTLVSFDTSEKWHSVKQWLEKSSKLEKYYIPEKANCKDKM